MVGEHGEDLPVPEPLSGGYRLYKNLLWGRQEMLPRTLQLTTKFVIRPFDWQTTAVVGAAVRLVTAERCFKQTLLWFESQIPLCFFHRGWAAHRRDWARFLVAASTPRQLAAAFTVFEDSLKRHVSGWL